VYKLVYPFTLRVISIPIYSTSSGYNNKEERYSKYLDYQIPVTQLNGNNKQQNEIKMRNLPAVDRFKLIWALEWAWQWS